MTTAAAEGSFGRLRARLRGLAAGIDVRAGGNRRMLLAYGAWTVLVFGVCFLATFPHDLVLQRALRTATARAPFRVETGVGSLGWSLAYAIDSLRIRSQADDAEPLLLAEALRFAPSRLGLLFGNPYPLGIGAALYGGTLRATIDPRPASFRVDAALEGVDLARYTGLRPWVDGVLRGRLEGAVDLDGGGRGPAAASGTVALKIPGLALDGVKIRGITVPDLHFGDVHLNGSVKNGRLEVSELVADGDEVDIRGEGNVLLREPLDASVVSVDLTLTPAPGAPDGLKLAINMLPGTSGDGGARRIGIVGTLGKPTVR
jgi:type II secretion system protein N